MNTENKNIEEIFSNAFEGHTMAPDKKVLRKLRLKLWKKDFFSVNLQKFNFIYASIILGAGMILPYNLLSEQKVHVSTEAIVLEKAGKNENVTVQKDVHPEAATLVAESAAPKNIKKEVVSPAAIARFKSSVEEGCAPLMVTFENHSQNATSYYWEFGDGEVSKEKAPVHKYKAPGEYEAKLFVKGHKGKKLTYQLAIKVYEKPTSDFSLNIDQSDIETKKIVFENKSVGATSYIWDFGDRSPLVDAPNAMHTYSEYKAYPVKLIAVSQHGCADTLLKTNKFIDKNYLLSFPLSFRPNRIGAANNGYYGKSGSENNIFYPQNNGVKEYELAVFAPNGMQVFADERYQTGLEWLLPRKNDAIGAVYL